MNYKNTLEEIKKEMRIRAITDELLAEQIKMPKEKLKRKLDGIDVIEVDELVDILSYLELSVNRVTEIYEKYKKQEMPTGRKISIVVNVPPVSEAKVSPRKLVYLK